MTKLVLSPEVVNLEAKETKLKYEDHYKESRELDPIFSDVMDNFQDQLAANKKDYFGSIIVRNHAEEERLYINLEKATEVLNKAMLTIYYLMQVQAEINEINPGTKDKRK